MIQFQCHCSSTRTPALCSQNGRPYRDTAPAYNQTNENEAKMQEDLQNIYTSVSSEESKLSVKAPPAELLIITLRKLDLPSIVLFRSFPETLDVLSGIEAWRIKQEKIADQALVSEEYWPNYKVDYPSGLTDDDSAFAEIEKELVELIQQITKGNFVQPEIRVPIEVELQAMTESYLVHVQEQNDKLEKLFDAPGYMYSVGTKLEDVDLDEK
ncbi:hypothetical protein BT96DRAFT_1019328 [Gymnopus androsaceus JB14]|uniref:Uncharacterized protein n=1 Tax=Gymnopus androsaceus JB14 TaxID=1447944 RepID=A0A6A4HRV7_9AGAR|nr:hypothetical protein BT96DRAFT_1019328 [Gymnopus androsaceus JB14]